jgi:hypothetical protein
MEALMRKTVILVAISLILAPQICKDEPGFDRAAFHEQFDAAVVAFFKTKFSAAE